MTLDGNLTLDANPERAAQLCIEAQQRLMASVAGLTDAEVRGPSLLPDWTVGHVLTHLARNADGLGRRIDGALDGRDVPKYPGGTAQREGDIEAGAGRSAQEIISDLANSQTMLETVLARYAEAGFPNGHFLGGEHYGVAACPAHRLREVEMHHADLGLGYGPADWPEEYVEWDLPVLLATVPERLASASDRRMFMAWLAGRGPLAAAPALDPW
ncbi:maleylpyruvate isomerase N-terminal domain-containing protein [Arthrobacter sp. zg-Y750]|uniref:maleylpyruvate isomerase N-terminal domain-containing protein n=1 Tax=Arthrobacter sp. zg-Y750 TaxID=2894189 RepID=UPI001E4931BA|nr:maleylpyruvate isomerase family mycothiol-dependent enzyme [Arthrobacter sp. zg-Y750]MCC9176859.1 maleylpyruvate isomerase family mycothiol-dependent enzyme [Arthrobacter sp. zg-Y750]